ncbi:MAG: hypothetical protein ACOVP6_04165 [Lacibacter sp.]
MTWISRFAFLISCALLLVTGLFYYPKWEQKATESTLSWDVSGYYMYLPALFIYKDLKGCGFRDKIISKYKPAPDFQQAFEYKPGVFVMKYSSGQAFMMSPFFFAGHYIALKTHYLNDGFSYPYQIAIGLGMLIYAMVGLWYLRKVLLRYFSDGVTALSIITIVFATNYLNYAAIDGAMTHNSLFMIYSVLLWSTIRFYEHPTLSKAAWIGLLIGMAILIRPTECISAMIPVFWGLGSLRLLKERLLFFMQKPVCFLVPVLIALSIVSVQLFYWKWATGDWIVYSYQQEGFSWLHPHFYDGFFNAKGGWLLYTPVWVLFFVGLPFLFRTRKFIFAGVALFAFFFIYICFAWDIWWYGGCLGIRAMVQAYPVLIFSVAAFFTWCFNQRPILIAGCFTFLAFCGYYNLWLTHQAHRGGLLRPGEMTTAYLKAILFRYEVDETVQLLLDNAEQIQFIPASSGILYSNDFEADTTVQIQSGNGINGKSLVLDATHQFSPEYTIPMYVKPGTLLRAMAKFKSEEKEWDTWKMTQFIVKFYSGTEVIKTNSVRVCRVLQPGTTRTIVLDAVVPRRECTAVTVSIWNSGSDKKIYVDDLKVLKLKKASFLFQ